MATLESRVTRLEEVIPTLATKEDLERFATKEDLDSLAAMVAALQENMNEVLTILRERS